MDTILFSFHSPLRNPDQEEMVLSYIITCRQLQCKLICVRELTKSYTPGGSATSLPWASNSYKVTNIHWWHITLYVLIEHGQARKLSDIHTCTTFMSEERIISGTNNTCILLHRKSKQAHSYHAGDGLVHWMQLAGGIERQQIYHLFLDRSISRKLKF